MYDSPEKVKQKLDSIISEILLYIISVFLLRMLLPMKTERSSEIRIINIFMRSISLMR